MGFAGAGPRKSLGTCLHFHIPLLCSGLVLGNILGTELLQHHEELHNSGQVGLGVLQVLLGLCVGLFGLSEFLVLLTIWYWPALNSPNWAVFTSS